MLLSSVCPSPLHAFPASPHPPPPAHAPIQGQPAPPWPRLPPLVPVSAPPPCYHILHSPPIQFLLLPSSRSQHPFLLPISLCPLSLRLHSPFSSGNSGPSSSLPHQSWASPRHAHPSFPPLYAHNRFSLFLSPCPLPPHLSFLSILLPWFLCMPHPSLASLFLPPFLPPIGSSLFVSSPRSFQVLALFSPAPPILLSDAPPL